MINFLADDLLLSGYSCAGTKLFPLFQMAKFFIVIIQIAVPFGLVIFGSLDFFKALIANDEKEMARRKKPFISRVVAALIIFFLPWMVQFISKQATGKKTKPSFWKCYAEAKPKIDFSSWQKAPTSSGSGKILGGSSGHNVVSNGQGQITLKSKCSDYTAAGPCESLGTDTYTCKWNASKSKCENGTKKKTTGGSGGSGGTTTPTITCGDYGNKSKCEENGCKWTNVPGYSHLEACMKK